MREAQNKEKLMSLKLGDGFDQLYMEPTRNLGAKFVQVPHKFLNVIEIFEHGGE